MSLAAASAVLVMAVTPCLAQGPAGQTLLKGSWQLDTGATSSEDASDAAPSFVVTRADKSGIEFLVSPPLNAGPEPMQEYRGAYDGRLYPFGDAGAMMSFFWEGADRFTRETRLPGDIRIVEHGRLENAGRSLRLYGRRIARDGSRSEFIHVYQRIN